MPSFNLKDLIKKAKETTQNEQKPNAKKSVQFPPTPITFSTQPINSLKDIEKNKVTDDCYLIENFLTEKEEKLLLANLLESTDKNEFKQLRSGKKTASFGGEISNEGFFKKDNVSEYLHELMKPLGGLFEDQLVDQTQDGVWPNHILVNDYEAGVGIMPHVDGPAYEPLVAIISLNSTCVMEFYEKNPENKNTNTHLNSTQKRPSKRVFLPRRSLLIFHKSMYFDYLHGISFTNTDFLNKVCNEEMVFSDFGVEKFLEKFDDVDDEVSNKKNGENLREILMSGRKRGHRVSLTIRCARFDKGRGNNGGETTFDKIAQRNKV